MLLFVRGDERFQFGFAHRFVVRKVSRIAFEFAAEKFVHFGNADVEKIAVVADEQKFWMNLWGRWTPSRG